MTSKQLEFYSSMLEGEVSNQLRPSWTEKKFQLDDMKLYLFIFMNQKITAHDHTVVYHRGSAVKARIL